MCGPNQFQYFDRAARQFYPAASLRSYSADILMYEARSVDRPVVLIQDYGDGSNFAHFAFDWLPRIMHAIESGLIDPKACIFVMGGRKVPFQMLLLDALISHYKLDWSNFLFPESRLVLDIGDRFVFFSDQRLVPLHPAQMAHPRSISLIRDLCAQIRTPVGIDEGPKIFISREDAKLRRIANEAELSTAAHKAGYHVIRMGDHPIERQIAIVRNARYVVGPHGMGLTHLIFNRGPMGVFELFHPSLGTDAYSLMARALGFHYHWYVGKEILDHKGSYSVDAAEFESTLSNLQW
jgi:capsular polysaccharide biosynthesis protein